LVLGKTVPAYRFVLEDEIGRWGGFVRVLGREDREAFEALMDMCRNYASAGSNATNPIVFEPMVMAILLGQQRRIRELEQKLKSIQPNSAAASTIQIPKEPESAEPKITIPAATSGGEQARLN
jgi:hypothetical protein